MDQLLSFCRIHDRIYCFGTGENSRFVNAFLRKKNIQVDGFIVSPSKKGRNPGTYHGLPVYNALDIQQMEGNIGIVLSIDPKYYDEIKGLIKNDSFYMNENLLIRIRYEIEYPLADVSESASVWETKLGKYTKIYDDAEIYDSKVGDYSYIGKRNCVINAEIGKFCSFAPDVKCGLGMHPSEGFVTTHPAFFSLGGQIAIRFTDQSYFTEYLPIHIGNDVWIGANAIILAGITIGDGAILAAGAVVTKNVPPYAIVGGVPSKLIRYRFNHEQIKILLNYPWWDNSEDWFVKNYKLLHSIDRYIQYVKRKT